MWSTELDHFLHLSFKDMSALENTSDSVDFGKKIKLLFYVYYLSERNKPSTID